MEAAFFVAFFCLLAAFLVVFPVAFVAVDAAVAPVSTGFGGNHTTLVAFSFATKVAPRTAHLSRSATLFH